MTRERIGQVVFLGAVAVAAAFYGLTAPEGLPWNESVRLAAAYCGGSGLPGGQPLPYPIWGFHVQAFGGAVSLAILMAAIAAGLLGALVNRWFGWRFAASAAIVWIFLPGVWNRAITGERGVCVAAMIVVAAWAANAAVLGAVRKMRAARWSAPTGVGMVGGDNLGAPSAHEVHEKYAKVNRIAGWVAMGAAGIFAVVSMSMHDYRLGEAASAFARGVVEEAGERIIVANGLVDEQICEEVEGCRLKVEQRRIILLRNDGAYRKDFVAWVRREWPNETNLWVAAEVSPTAFVQVAEKRWPERFYLMNGASTTAEGWEKRWNDFAPHLKSSDRFAAVAKIAFAHEGEAVAKRLEAAGDRKGAKRIREKLPRAVGRAVPRAPQSSKNEAALNSDCGGQGTARPTDLRDSISLIEWSNEMTAAMERGDRFAAGRIARAILSNPAWAGYIPANAIMGTIASSEGDNVASEAFFRVATDTTNAVPPVVLNDYADTLMRLGKLDKAEAMARRAVKESDEKDWLARLTLAEVLEKKAGKLQLVEVVENGEKAERYVKPEGAEKMEAEAKALLKAVMRHAPEPARARIRSEHKGFVR